MRRHAGFAGRRRERGFSLAEIAVASALALTALLIALASLGEARRVFDRGELASDEQQQVRQAFDEMVRELRLAGFNVQPDGPGARVDEALEGAWDGAIFIRADFDASDSSGLASDPESLIGGIFGFVTTGNDEIAGFVLRKASGSGGTTLSLEADVNSPVTVVSSRYGAVAVRDDLVETVSPNGVFLTQTAPPYTLYRVSFSNAASGFGTGGFIQYEPVADNIKSLTFRYYGEADTHLTPPGGAESVAALRAAVRRIEVELVGLTQDSDPNYIDPADPMPATRHFRKFTLTADVTPRNPGLFGSPEPPVSTSGNPSGLSS